jgi:DNA-binding transcriptional ArsR family regulator
MGSFRPFNIQKIASTIGAQIRSKRQDCNPLPKNGRLDKSHPEYYIHIIEYDFRGIDMDEWTSLARDFKALGHPVRLAILDALRGGEQCVCHLESALGMRQAYISQQLAVLKEAGIIRERRDGWNMYYRVIRPDIFALIERAGGLASRPGKAFDRLHRARAPIADCPCPKCSPEDEVGPRKSSASAAPKAAAKATV